MSHAGQDSKKSEPQRRQGANKGEPQRHRGAEGKSEPPRRQDAKERIARGKEIYPQITQIDADGVVLAAPPRICGNQRPSADHPLAGARFARGRGNDVTKDVRRDSASLRLSGSKNVDATRRIRHVKPGHDDKGAAQPELPAAWSPGHD